jgi:hypothetical protein
VVGDGGDAGVGVAVDVDDEFCGGGGVEADVARYKRKGSNP